MSGTILITGANGSLALEFIKSLLSQYPSYTVIGTVRSKNAESDPPSALKALKSQFPESNLILYTLDLSSLGAVRVFTAKMNDMIESGTYPRLAAVICNAFSWSLSGGQKYSKDKYENTFQVSHLSHHLLVLSLLKSMDTTRGRIVMLGSSTHDPDNANPLCKLRARFPSNVEELVHPTADAPGEEHDRGFQRYGTAKLANVMFMHELNERLANHPTLAEVTVTAMDPGGLVDSRAPNEQKLLARLLMASMNMFITCLKPFTTMVRSSEDAGADLVQIAAGSEFHGKRGYFVGLRETESARISKDLGNRSKLWRACAGWLELYEETLL